MCGGGGWWGLTGGGKGGVGRQLEGLGGVVWCIREREREREREKRQVTDCCGIIIRSRRPATVSIQRKKRKPRESYSLHKKPIGYISPPPPSTFLVNNTTQEAEELSKI